VAGTERNDWATDSMRSAVKAVQDKKMGFLKDLLEPVRTAHDKQSNLNHD
jgi:hypothetical protein